MILTALFSITTIIITRAISYFPNADTSVTTAISTSISNFKTTLASAGWIVPIDTLFTIIQIVLLIELSLFSFRVVRWILSIITIGLSK